MTLSNQSPRAGPFGMGRQGYLVIALIILTTSIFAASRRDWMSMLIIALVLPLIMFAIVHLLSGFWRGGTSVRDRRRGSGEGVDLLPFLARTNPIMFLFLGALSRHGDADQYQQLLRSGPYGMGQQGYIFALLVILAPLTLALIIIALTGQPPTHSGPHLP